MTDSVHPRLAFFEDDIVPMKDAKISIATQVVNYGIGAFGGIRANWNLDQQELYLFRLDDHLLRFDAVRRLFNAQMQYELETLKSHILDLLRQEEYHEDAYVRPLVYSAAEDLKPRLFGTTFKTAVLTWPFGQNYLPEGGTRACVSSWRKIDDNVTPARGKITGAYVSSAFEKSEAHWNDYDEAIVLNQDGTVAEGSAMNIFIVRDGKLITTPVSANILEGITRRTTIELAREMGIEVVERVIGRSELYIADEVFFSGTAAGIAPVISVDKRYIGTGKEGTITSSLHNAYQHIIRGGSNSHRDWLTPVYIR